MKFMLIAGYLDSVLNFRGELIAALNDKNIEVHIVAPHQSCDNQLRRQLESRGLTVHNVKLHRTGMNPLIDFVTLTQLCMLMLRIRPDFVLGYTIKPVIYGTLAALLTGVPKRFALVTGLGYAFNSLQVHGARRWLRLIIQRLYFISMLGAHKVFFQNPDDERLFRLLGLLRKTTPSCVLNGSGVDLVRFNVTSLPSSPRFLLVARLLGDKGVREYIEAARRVRARFDHVEFALAGWIDENPDAIKQSELDSWVSEGVVEYLGRLKDVRPAISACNVLVLPSYREGTPRTVLEAMAMGRAIITTDAPGCRETVVSGYNGYLVPVKKIDELVQAMISFIERPDLISLMGLRSRQRAEEKYDVHSVNRIMLKEMGIS